MIRLSEVTKTFPGRSSPAIRGINLTIRDGEILGLVGLNGAGKTTTIRVAVGLAKPTEGAVDVDGHDIVSDKPGASERVGWVPELFPFDPSAKALQLLVYYAGFNGITGSSARTLARELLAEVGLASVDDHRIRTFSQGMKRRFGIAAVMLADPHNLLLDEVMNGLDPEGIAFVRTWITGQRRSNKAVLLSSHFLSELDALADRVAFVHEGRLIRVVDREDISKAAGTLVRVTIENLDAACVEFLRSLGTAQEERGSVTIANPTIGTPEIIAELTGRGYRIAELRVERQSLEAYFFQLLDTVR
jgi:ABC-2 type transport system ATP-binding protein